MRCLIVVVILILFTAVQGAESEKWLEYEIIEAYESMEVDVTWYTSSIYECDSTPYITADGSRVKRGILAVSVDLLHTFSYGDSVYIEDLGFYTIHDRMNSRWNRRVDIWCEDRREAFRNGIMRKMIKWNFREEVKFKEVQ